MESFISKEALSELRLWSADAAAKTHYTHEIIELRGHTYLKVGEKLQEITTLPPDPITSLVLPKLGSLQAVVDVVNQWGCETTVVSVSSDGIRVDLRADAHALSAQTNHIAQAPFFRGDDAPQGVCDFETIRSWLERFPGDIGMTEISESQEDAIFAAIAELRAYAGGDLKVVDNGAVQNITYTTQSGVEARGAVPAFIRVNHRAGLREFKAPHLYRLKLKRRNSGDAIQIVGTLTRIESDGVLERWQAWAMESIRAGVKHGLVIAGA